VISPKGFSPFVVQLPEAITSFGWLITLVQTGTQRGAVRLLAEEAVPKTPGLRDYQARRLEITIDRIISFRATDEGDLLHYWGVRTAEGIDPKTSIYKIEHSAFLDEIRGASPLPWSDEFIHLMVAGEDLCVEIIAEPEIDFRVIELENRKLN
jgi:hypothetical protein